VVWSVIVGRLSDLGACNTYDALLRNKADVAAWVANIFAGDDNISPFEEDTGTSVKSPILRDLDLTEESKKTRGVIAKSTSSARELQN